MLKYVWVAILYMISSICHGTVLYENVPTAQLGYFTGVWSSNSSWIQEFDQVSLISGSTLNSVEYVTYSSTEPSIQGDPRFRFVARMDSGGIPGGVVIDVPVTISGRSPASATNRSDLSFIQLSFTAIQISWSSLWVTVTGGQTQFNPMLGTFIGGLGDGTRYSLVPKLNVGGFAVPAGDLAIRLSGALPISPIPEPSVYLQLGKR